MYRRNLMTENIFYEIITSLFLGGIFLFVTTFYLQHSKAIETLGNFFSGDGIVLEISVSAPKIPSSQEKEYFIKSLGNEDFVLGKIARQVALLSLSSVQNIPTNKVFYNELKRFSSLHKAYISGTLTEYKYLESYLLESLSRDRIAKQSYNKNILAMKKYILTINPKVGYTYASMVAKKIIEVADKYNMPYPLLGGLIGTESTYNKVAVSHVGAAGLTQVYPKVWKKTLIQKGIIDSGEDLYTIDKNIESGAYILDSYYRLGIKLKHKNPLRYALHRYYGARDNSYVGRVYKHSKNIAKKALLLA